MEILAKIDANVKELMQMPPLHVPEYPYRGIDNVKIVQPICYILGSRRKEESLARCLKILVFETTIPCLGLELCTMILNSFEGLTAKYHVKHRQ